MYWGYDLGLFDLTFWQDAMIVECMSFCELFCYFLLNEFIAYLMLRFGNPDEKSKDFFVKILTARVFKINPKASV